MIDFSMKARQKSPEEKAFEELNAQYEKQFGKPYVFAIGFDSNSWSETLADIRRRIAENDPQPEPDYQPGDLY